LAFAPLTPGRRDVVEEFENRYDESAEREDISELEPNLGK
jgi:hypothetical protein